MFGSGFCNQEPVGRVSFLKGWKEKAWGHWVKGVVVKFLRDQCIVDASALSYVTILSLVPLIVITFSLLSAFASLAALKERILDYLLKFMVPGSASAVVNYITGFSAKAKTMGLGGLIALFSLAFSLFSAAEQSLSHIWKVKRNRTFINRLFVFTNILFWVPLLLGASFYLSTKVAFIPYLGGVARLYFMILPLIISWVAFSFFLLIVPPCRVKVSAAVAGGGVAALLWELAKHGFDLFVTHAFSIKAFSVLYGSLMVFPVFLIWIYLCWIITLLGAEVSYVVHYGGNWEDGRPCVAGFLTSVALLTRLAKGFLEGEGPLPEEELVSVSGIGIEATRGILEVLGDAGMVVETEKGYLLGRPPESIFLRELVGLFVPPGVSQRGLKGVIVQLEDALGHTSLVQLMDESAFPGSSAS